MLILPRRHLARDADIPTDKINEESYGERPSSAKARTITSTGRSHCAGRIRPRGGKDIEYWMPRPK